MSGCFTRVSTIATQLLSQLPTWETVQDKVTTTLVEVTDSIWSRKRRRRSIKRFLRQWMPWWFKAPPQPAPQPQQPYLNRHQRKLLIENPEPMTFTFDRRQNFGENNQHQREFHHVDEHRLWNALADPNNYQDKLPEIFICCDRINLNGPFQMSTAGLQSLQHDNAGGKSEISEAASITYFQQLWKAQDFVFERQIEYWVQYKMIDFICTLPPYGRLGVSVTRAMGFPSAEYFTYEDAKDLLQKKLEGLIIARNAVSERHTFYHSVLHAWCQDERIAGFLARAYQEIDLPEVHGTVILLLTICSEPWIYRNTYTPEVSLQLETTPPTDTSSPEIVHNGHDTPGTPDGLDVLEGLSMFA